MAYLSPKIGPGLRRPTDNSKEHGKTVNPPRYAEFGGLSSAAKALTKNKLTIKVPGGGAT